MTDESAIGGEDQVVVVRCYRADVRIVDHLREAALSESVVLPVNPDSAFLL